MIPFANEIVKKIWKDRYQKNGETPEENLHRVAKWCSLGVKEDEDKFFEIMDKGLFFPAGRVMSNAGIGKELSCNNCFTAPVIRDDLSDIFAKVALGARTHQRGGGIGYDFSNLRPKGSPTSNDAVASGAVSFMDVFNAQTATILQGNRRGANMGVMNIYAMDIEDFVTAKSKDPNKLNHFNLSVMVDDDFINAVKQNADIYLHFPVYDDHGHIIKDPNKWQYSRKVSAKVLWDLITRQAYDTGEPGVLFYDNMNKDNNLWYTESIVATNPCLTGGMKLLTADGYKTFKELDGKEFAIINLAGNATWSKVWCSGRKHVITLVLDNGEKIKCTPDHRFATMKGTDWRVVDVEAKDLKGCELLTHGDDFTQIDRYAMVIDIVDTGEIAPVYDFTEPIHHYGFVNGVIAHNCGEYLAGTVWNGILPPEQYGGACNLGSLFLHRFVRNPFTPHASVDWDLLEQTIYTAVRMLDNVIEINHFPDKIYENYQKTFRTIGLGTTGLADMLVMLGMKYNSQEARDFVDSLYDFISVNAYGASCKLATERGSFPGLDRAAFINSGYLLKQPDWGGVADNIRKNGIRNAKLLSIAPCGTLSLAFGNNCSSGIEPIFQLEYQRKVKFGGQSEEDSQTVNMMDDAYKMWTEMPASERSVSLDDFVTALDISVEDHLAMLAVIAKHVDMSVSKTINIPTDYSFEDTQEVYMKAHDLGIKGCTIFRPNAIRQGILISNKEEKPKEEKKSPTLNELPRGYVLDTTNDCIGRKRKLVTGCGSLHCTAWFDPVTGDLLEVFLDKGSSGGCERNLQAISRMISISARAGVDVHAIVKQLLSVGACNSYCVRTATKHDTSKGSACASAVGYALIEMWQDVQDELFSGDVMPDEEVIEDAPKTAEIKSSKPTAINKSDFSTAESNPVMCPMCGEPLVFEGGCVTCKSCGYNKCE